MSDAKDHTDLNDSGGDTGDESDPVDNVVASDLGSSTGKDSDSRDHGVVTREHMASMLREFGEE
eukprot:5283516-Alexandrium_andersonii.AAC.1